MEPPQNHGTTRDIFVTSLYFLFILFLSSFASRKAAMEMCNDLGGTLPVLDSEEDVGLFHAETGYMTLIYLGVTTNHDSASPDHYTWTDQSHLNFLTDVVGIYAPQAETYSAETGLIKNITLSNISTFGKCVALVYFPLLPSWKVVTLPCDVPFNVSLYCSGKVKHNNVEYNTTSSTIHIDTAGNNFIMINKDHYCSNDNDGIHWFQQDKVCLRVDRCLHKSFHNYYKCCEPHQLYVFQTDDAQSGKINDSSITGRFLSLFKAKFTARGERIGNALKVFFPVIYYNNTETIHTDKFLSVYVQEAYNYFWALKGAVDVVSITDPVNSHVLCANDTIQPVKATCHPSYFKCSDGTCVDDHLVCDGRQHCMNGEDETTCTGICTQSTGCALHCSYGNDCHCARGYFQCHNGGCIPVGKLCDGASNCADGSDEPITCTFASALTHRKRLEETWTNRKHQCLHEIQGEVFLELSYLFNITNEAGNNCSTNSSFLLEDIGIRALICTDNVRYYDDMYSIEFWCIYSYSWFPATGYAHCPCVNGYHLSSCENMHCIDTFKCLKSYCIKWNYVCDHMCDCPLCEDESICTNVSCPGMILHESAHGKVYCNEQADDRLAAVLIQASSYDLYTHAQSEMCAQVLNCNEANNSIVYLDLLYGDHLADHSHVTMEMMEFLIYCNTSYFNLVDTDAKYLQNMIAVQYLDLSHNNIRNNISFIFTRMTQLVYLDLSSNQLSHLRRFFLCVSSNLTYLFLQSNSLIYLHNYVFYVTKQLIYLHLSNNALRSRSVDSELLKMQSSLTKLFSDLPRLCCMVEPTANCEPKFTLFVSCSDMINSKFHFYLAWIIGITSSVCNITGIKVLLISFWTRGLLGKQPLTFIMSVNITLADMIASVCLTSLSFYNVYYKDSFGIHADAWRQSIGCYALELSIFVCTECSLIFSVYLAVVSYYKITSLIQKPHSIRKYLSIVVSVWLTIIVLGICKISIWEYFHANDFNYYCLPYQMIKVESTSIKTIQSCIIIANILLIVTYIFIQYCLFRYLLNHTKNTSGVFKTRIQNHKVAVRMSCLIVSHILTWTPLLVTQLVIMYWKNITPSTLLLILLASLPANLLVNPIILVKPFLTNK